MSKQCKILVVDDEETICEVLKINLELSGYKVDCAYSAESALKHNLEEYSMLILDVMMGEMSGFELATKLRQNIVTSKIPIIICTAKDSEQDLVEGFNCGVDDYIKKPFSMKELLLRVRSVLRRIEDYSISSKVKFEEIELDADKKVCLIDGVDVQLTKKEYEILYLFLESINKIFSREEILDKVWESDVLVIDRTIDVNINRLRKKIGKYGANIITKLGYGYGFKG